MAAPVQSDSSSIYFWVSISINLIVLISSGSFTFIINSIRREIKNTKESIGKEVKDLKSTIEDKLFERYENQKEFCCQRYKACADKCSVIKENISDIYSKITRMPAIEERLRAGNEKFESLDRRIRILEGGKE
jgi:hypothetical protein